MNIGPLDKKYPNMDILFGTYFNPEWDMKYSSIQDVIIDFSNNSEIDELLDAMLEIQDLKREFPDDEKLKFVIAEDLGLAWGLSFNYLKMTGAEWLDFVASIIKQELNNRKPKT